MDMAWFDHFPEPVFYLESGRIQYSNAAALALEPEWTAGAGIPNALAIEPDEEGVFSCTLGGQEFQASATRSGGGLLLVLRRPVQDFSGAVLAALPVQLREIMNTVQAAVQMLTPVVEDSQEGDARMHLSILQQGFYRLLRLTRHLELAERAGRDGEELSAAGRQAIDLAELCRTTVYGAAGLAKLAGVTFREDIPGGMVPCAGDRELLEIMLLELISNAIKAAGRGGEAGLRLACNRSQVMITVWDNGPGVSQADLTAMMNGSSPDSLPKPGTGLRLGLSIARYAAAAHAGTILLESPKGQGLRATAALPLKKPGKLTLHSPCPHSEEGFPLLLTLLSDALPWQAFEE